MPQLTNSLQEYLQVNTIELQTEESLQLCREALRPLCKHRDSL